MRSFVFLGLAACWASSTKSPEAKSEVVTEPATAATPASKPTPRYVLPTPIADALAAERLAGNVLVPAGATLQATLAAARAETEKPARGRPTAMTVIRDHGAVVELSTAPTPDCAAGFEQPYQLTVFVKREKLVPRTKVEVTKAFADGTAVAIDRGAPVEIGENGLIWEAAALAETKVMPTAEQLTYAVPPSLPPAALPAAKGERLVCDKDKAQTVAAFRAEQQRAHEREMQAQAEKRRAELERQQAELERKRKEQAAKQPKQPKRQGAGAKMTEADIARFAELLASESSGHSEGDLSRRRDDERFSALYDERFLQWCGVVDPSRSFSTPGKVSPPTVNGSPVSWPSYVDGGDNEHVTLAGTRYLADVGVRCGRVRMAVEREGVRYPGGAAGVGGGPQVQVWVPAPGPVTWPDGSPAGTYNGTKKYRTVVENGDRICVQVRDVAELVCHPKKTAKQTMAFSYGLD